MFSEPDKAVAAVPSPRLFVDVIQHQWASLGSAPLPTAADKHYFNVGLELAQILQTPSIDAPITALLSTSNIPGEPEDGLRPSQR